MPPRKWQSRSRNGIINGILTTAMVLCASDSSAEKYEHLDGQTTHSERWEYAIRRCAVCSATSQSNTARRDERSLNRVAVEITPVQGFVRLCSGGDHLEAYEDHARIAIGLTMQIGVGVRYDEGDYLAK